MDPEDADYKCTLSPETLEKAIKELNEDPKQRLGQIQTLRKWIKEQPHLVCRTDTRFLLAMLRRSKFSQLKARELIENILRVKVLLPEYMNNIDTHDPGLLGFIDRGVIVHFPKKDKDGSRIVLLRTGQIDLEDQKFGPVNEIRCSISVNEMLKDADEAINVDGWIFIIDFTGVGAKHMTRMPMDVHRKISKIFQDSTPDRVKSFHMYNAGTFIEIIMTMVRQFMKKKHQERLRIHDTMESLYKAVPMELWPDEYLPDDYKGPSAGSITSIQAGVKKRLMDPDWRKHFLDYTSDRYKIDESKRPLDPAPNESFRRLNVD